MHHFNITYKTLLGPLLGLLGWRLPLVNRLTHSQANVLVAYHTPGGSQETHPDIVVKKYMSFIKVIEMMFCSLMQKKTFVCVHTFLGNSPLVLLCHSLIHDSTLGASGGHSPHCPSMSKLYVVAHQ